MRTVHGIQRLCFLYFALLTFVLAFVLVACGSNTNTGAGSNATPTVVKGYGTSVGCPSDAVVSGTPAKANVVVQASDMNKTIQAHMGDVIEVRLAFGHKWSGPSVSQGVLELQQPGGYAWKAENVCVWRFVAKGTGTTELLFHSQALCKPGEVCPLYIASIPFTIVVK